MIQTSSYALPAHTKIDKYEIIDVLGEGGFGITYRALHSRLKNHIAIKEYLPIEQACRNEVTLNVMPRTHRSNDYYYGLEQFLNEGKRLILFKHPNIVRVFDFVEANGTAYLLMDYEEGETLGDCLKKRSHSLSEAEVIQLLIAVLKGLQAVHQKKLLHRDIKPDNIYIRKNGEPLLIDFGSSRYALGVDNERLSTIVSDGYSPPEQYVSDGHQGPQTDLYAMGAVLYELLTGNPPIGSTQRIAIIAEDDTDPLIPAVEAAKGCYSDWLLKLTDDLLVLSFKNRLSNIEVILNILQKAHHQQENTSKANTKGEGSKKTKRVDDEKRWQPTAKKGNDEGTKRVDDKARWQKTSPLEDEEEACWSQHNPGQYRSNPPNKEKVSINTRGKDFTFTVLIDIEDSFSGAHLPVEVSLPGEEVKKLTVRIPKGALEGDKIRIKGEGYKGLKTNGNLIAEIRFKSHDDFTVEERDIHQTLLVSRDNAKQGKSLLINTLGGSVNMTLPKDKKEGETLRLKGRGLPSSKEGGMPGDHYVHFQIMELQEDEIKVDEIEADEEAVEENQSLFVSMLHWLGFTMSLFWGVVLGGEISQTNNWYGIWFIAKEFNVVELFFYILFVFILSFICLLILEWCYKFIFFVIGKDIDKMFSQLYIVEINFFLLLYVYAIPLCVSSIWKLIMSGGNWQAIPRETLANFLPFLGL